MSEIRVLHIVGSMNMGGIQVFIMNLLRAIDPKKIVFDFACMNTENYFETEIKERGGQIFVIGSRKKLLSHFLKLKNVLTSHEYNCIHIHASHSICVLDAIVAKIFSPKSKIIFHSHTTQSVSPYIHKLLRIAIPFFSDEYLACSFEAARWMFPDNIIKNHRYKLIPNGIKADLYRFDYATRTSVRDKLGLSKNQCVIGHIGRQASPKNHLYLLDIFCELLKEIPTAKLVLVGGEGDKTQEIKRKINELEIEDNILLLGVRKDISDLLSAFDVVVFPSLHEGLPISIIEAQAAGVPCVISDTITQEVVLTSLVKKLSLNDPTTKWCKVISEQLAYTINKRLIYNDEIRHSAFDMENTIKIMCCIYNSK